MNKDEFDQIMADRDHHYDVASTDFVEGTLVYGYTVDRLTFHVYVRGTAIHLVISDRNERVTHHSAWGHYDLRDLWPDKRAYPEACSAVFVEHCQERGFFPTFTTWSDTVRNWVTIEEARFAGVVCPCNLERGGHRL